MIFLFAFVRKSFVRKSSLLACRGEGEPGGIAAKRLGVSATDICSFVSRGSRQLFVARSLALVHLLRMYALFPRWASALVPRPVCCDDGEDGVTRRICVSFTTLVLGYDLRGCRIIALKTSVRIWCYRCRCSFRAVVPLLLWRCGKPFRESRCSRSP